MLIVSNIFVKVPLGIVLKVSCLNPCICKSNHGYNFRVVGIVKPTICFAHKVFFIGNYILCEEIIKVVITA